MCRRFASSVFATKEKRQETALTELWLANAVKATEGQVHGNYEMLPTRGNTVNCKVRSRSLQEYLDPD
jgi:hypothetical protein